MRFAKLQEIAKSAYFQNFILCIIVLDSVILGFMSLPHFKYFREFEMIDTICLYIFICEMVLKIIAFRLDFFKQKWNIFDFVIVVVSALPIFGNFLVLRLLRIFKILRLLSIVPQLRFVIAVMLKTLPSVVSIGFILMIVYYIYAILGIQLFATILPQYFGSLGSSFFTLFQIMTGDDWGNIARVALDKYPHSWVYFISFIFIVSFIILNMVVGIIVDSINEIKSQNNSNAKV